MDEDQVLPPLAAVAQDQQCQLSHDRALCADPGALFTFPSSHPPYMFHGYAFPGKGSLRSEGILFNLVLPYPLDTLLGATLSCLSPKFGQGQHRASSAVTKTPRGGDHGALHSWCSTCPALVMLQFPGVFFYLKNMFMLHAPGRHIVT